MGPRAVERRPDFQVSGFIPNARFTTVVILLINAGLYVATTLYSIQMAGGEGAFDIHPQVLLIFGAKLSSLIAAGDWWRLITAGFLHGGILHILMNSWVIFDLGTTVEEFYGTPRYLVLYLLSTIAGFMASTWYSPAMSVGASAPLFGLLGAMIAAGTKARTPMGSAIRAHYMQWAIWGVVMGFLPGLRIDNAAHLGGLAAGFIFGYVAGTRPLFEGVGEKLWKVAAALSILLTAFAFLRMAIFFATIQKHL
ncbi:MAG TPA: rhomboid family intramembrane serine protease [Bryobacteraceae bacterium]|nr:rhomboid family intramembrane serine protease [Bryobacteraceae bacterium]